VREKLKMFYSTSEAEKEKEKTFWNWGRRNRYGGRQDGGNWKRGKRGMGNVLISTCKKRKSKILRVAVTQKTEESVLKNNTKRENLKRDVLFERKTMRYSLRIREALDSAGGIGKGLFQASYDWKNRRAKSNDFLIFPTSRWGERRGRSGRATRKQ